MSDASGLKQAEKDRALQAVLSQEFDRIRSKNPSYSLRAFAKKLSLAPSALSEILQGKRGVSRRAAVKITSSLALAPDRREKLLAQFPTKRGTLPRAIPTQLVMDQYRAISDWYHFAILSLSETRAFQSSPAWVSKRLGLSKTVATAAIDRLVRLEMLHRDSKQNLSPTGKSYATPDHVAEISLRKAHAVNLELARSALEHDSIDQRDFTSMTMAIDPAKIPEAKKMIRKFQSELCTFLESGEKTEVFKVCTQLFSLSKNGEEND